MSERTDFDDGGSVQGFRMSVAMRAALEAALGVNGEGGAGHDAG